MMVSITDEVSDHGTVTVDKDDVAETIRPWFPEPTAEVTEAIDKLQGALTRREYTEGWETCLGIKIKSEPTYRTCGWEAPANT